MEHLNQWNSASWRDYSAKQLPIYQKEVEYYSLQIKAGPGIVTKEKIEELRSKLSEAEQGKFFVLQGGDCAESIDPRQDYPDSLVKLLNQMAAIIPKPVIKIARAAGQLAKPRTELYEKVGDIILPNYAGDMINSIEPTIEAREPDPKRLLLAYEFSKKIYKRISELDKEIYISHEAFNLEYEEALLQDNYLLSAHTVWVGNLNRNSPAHIEFVRGIKNPVGIKLDDKISPKQLLKLIETLNPDNQSGKLILIVRMGKAIQTALPPLLEMVQTEKCKLLWMSDPMHGNTFKTPDGFKNRLTVDIQKEITNFGNILHNNGILSGALQLEVTGDKVLECDGNFDKTQYKSLCDPRLNDQQAINIMRLINRQWQF